MQKLQSAEEKKKKEENRPLNYWPRLSRSLPPPSLSLLPSLLPSLPLHSRRTALRCAAVAVLASRLLIAVRSSSESLPLLLSLNKQLQLPVPKRSKIERAHPEKEKRGGKKKKSLGSSDKHIGRLSRGVALPPSHG